jgi:hypothetical protein
VSEPAAQLVIEGLTEEGRVFRPGDWIERLLETLAMYGADRRTGSRPYRGPERRFRQVSFLQAQICDGNKCLVVDLRLRDANPQAFEFLMEFVRTNRLRCR